MFPTFHAQGIPAQSCYVSIIESDCISTLILKDRKLFIAFESGRDKIDKLMHLLQKQKKRLVKLSMKFDLLINDNEHFRSEAILFLLSENTKDQLQK